jgi:hypothetical protein
MYGSVDTTSGMGVGISDIHHTGEKEHNRIFGRLCNDLLNYQIFIQN